MDTPILFPSRLLDQNFGMCITPQDMIIPSNNILHTNYFRPWKWYMQNVSRDCGSTIENNKNKFQITLDVQHFKPNEINVKVINKEIMIEGKHEERLDEHGIVSRQFMRRYPLPNDCEPENITCSLSSDGVLMVYVSKSTNNIKNEITVPIKLCDSFSKKELQSSNELNENASVAKKEEKCDLSKVHNNSQLMIKDEHSCLLKPEFIKETTSAMQKFNTKNETDELLKISENVGKSLSMTTTSDETLKTTTGNIGLGTFAATDKALKLATDMVGKTNITATGETYLKATDIDAKSSSESTDNTLRIMADMLGKTSMAASSETSSFSSSSMSSETITSQETSSSISSISSSLKASSERSSEICDTISAALKEAAENM